MSVLERITQPRAEIRQGLIGRTGSGARQILNARYDAPIVRQPISDAARLTENRRATQGCAVVRRIGECAFITVVNCASQAAFDEDLRREIERPGQAGIGIIGFSGQIDATADMGPRNEVGGEDI